MSKERLLTEEENMTLNIKGFSDTVQMEFAIADIRRYQQAYMKANNVKGIMVKYKKGWYAIGKGAFGHFVRPTEFRKMTDALESRSLKQH